ncbi:MAG: hypothetical protein ACFFBP_17765 [Promethearchaeota archaeon]
MTQQLLTEEQTVLDLVREYIEEHQHFNASAIIPFISSRFAKTSTNISVQGIKTILQSLVKKNLIIDGSRLTRENVLLNQNRKEIYNFILKYPGVYFYKIVKKLKMNIPVVGWHINILLKFNFIQKKKINDQEVYFGAEEKQELDEEVHFIRKEKSKKIIKYFLIDNDGVTKTRISKELNMHYSTINNYFDKLEKICLLVKKKLPNHTIFFLDEDIWYEKYNQYYESY